MAIEITSDSTHEDITKAVDQIIEARKGDDQKSDAQSIAEERDTPVTDTSAETTSGDDSSASDGDETGTKVDWLDDDLKAELSAYGIDEKGVSDFSSREELERAMRFFDKTALEAGRKALAEGEEEPKTRDERGRFQKKEEAEPESEATESRYEVSLDKDIYDEGLVDELARMRDHYESRLSRLETRLAEADSKVEEQLFDTLVDSMGYSDLFGTTGKENSKQLERRRDLFRAAKAQQVGLQIMGNTVDFDQSLVSRAARMVFADDISKKELKARTRKIAQQASNRMGGGETRPPSPQESLREWARREYKAREHAG